MEDTGRSREFSLLVKLLQGTVLCFVLFFPYVTLMHLGYSEITTIVFILTQKISLKLSCFLSFTEEDQQTQHRTLSKMSASAYAALYLQ